MEDLRVNLENVGFPPTKFNTAAFNEGVPNLAFCDTVTWLSKELAGLCDLENSVSQFTVEDLSENALGFLVEFSSLLKELGCPIKQLTTAPMEERLLRPEDKINAIAFLCSELEAAKMIALKSPKKTPTKVIELNESKTAKNLRETLICLGFSKPPEGITADRLFTELKKKLHMLSQPLSPKDIVGKVLFTGGRLSDKQWFQLEKLYNEILKEYKTRRTLLLTRLDVTINSFLWSDRLKSKANEVLGVYNKKKQILSAEPNVRIDSILSATEDLAVIEKTSSDSVRKNTKCSVNKVTIGAVPDRGGRPEEQQPPPPEIPSWQSQPSRGGGQSRGGGFHQGSNDNRGGYQGQRGGYQGSDRGPQGGGGYQGQRGGYQGSDRGHQSQRGGYQGSDRGHQSSDRGHQGQRGGYQGSDRGHQGQGGGGYQGQGGGYQGLRDGYQRQGGNVHIANNNYQSSNSYQTPQYVQQSTPQFGFGGYSSTPAGDNFQQYGAAAVQKEYQPRPRGGQRPFRGRGRGRY